MLEALMADTVEVLRLLRLEKSEMPESTESFRLLKPGFMPLGWWWWWAGLAEASIMGWPAPAWSK